MQSTPQVYGQIRREVAKEEWEGGEGCSRTA